MAIDEDDPQRLLPGLRRMGLIAPDEDPPMQALAGGVSSLIALAQTRAGPVCVKSALPRLRVQAEWLAPIERNSAEVAWLREVAAIAPGAVPEVIAHDPQGGAFAMRWLEPDRHPVWKTLLRDGQTDAAFARALGALLGRIHAHCAHRADLAMGFANDGNFHALRLDPYLGETARRHADLAPVLQGLIHTTASTRLTLVHGDVSPKNILCGPEGPVILDAECAWYGDPAFDIAFLLNHLLLKSVWRPQYAPGHLACWEALAQAYLAQVSWEPAHALQARTCHLLAGLMLARIDGKSPVEYLSQEAQRETVRSFSRRMLAAPPTCFADFREAWLRHHPAGRG